MHSRRLPTLPLHPIVCLFPPSSMLRSTILRLFLSLPPWRIPNNPPRDLPPRRLLFLSRSFVSFLPLTFSLIQQFHGSCHQPPYRFGVLTTGPPLPSSTLLIVTEGCDLCYDLGATTVASQLFRAGTLCPFSLHTLVSSTFRIALKYQYCSVPSMYRRRLVRCCGVSYAACVSISISTLV